MKLKKPLKMNGSLLSIDQELDSLVSTEKSGSSDVESTYSDGEISQIKSFSFRKIRHLKSKSMPPFNYSINVDEIKRRTNLRLRNLRNDAQREANEFVEKAVIVAKNISIIGCELISHCELPDWLKNNKYLYHCHRPQLDTFKLCFKSMFRYFDPDTSVHTETGNIWTHFIGLIILFFSMLAIYIRPYFSTDGSLFYPNGWKEYLCFSAFFLGGCSCLTFSWLFHTLYCHSPKISKLFAKLDYCGIALLISGSMIPVFYFGFYCNVKLMAMYMCIAAFLALLCIVVSLIDLMSTPQFRFMRGCLSLLISAIFLAFGLSSIVPIFHLFITYPARYATQVIQLYMLLLMGSLYVTGCLIYMFLVPERYFPGKLNILVSHFLMQVHSHQIFHVFVVAAALIHMYAICQMSIFRASRGQSCLLTETSYLKL